MTIDIFKPMSMGKEVFHPISFDENTFVMNWSVEGGGMVPPLVHIHMDEHFTVTYGEVTFTINKQKIIKQPGEELLVPKGVEHSIKNHTCQQVGLQEKYTPCADVHRIFEIVATLSEINPGSAVTVIDLSYVYPRLGLKEFSTIAVPGVMPVLHFVITVTGKLAGWDKLVVQFKKQ